MPIDPNIPFLALAGMGPGFRERRQQREKFQMEQEQQRQLQEERELALEEKRRAAEGDRLLARSYDQFTTTDPQTGRPTTDYDKLAAEMFRSGYHDHAERTLLRGQQMRKSDEDYYNSVLTHDKNTIAWKLAELSQVEGPADYTHLRERMRSIPGFKVSELPDAYDADWVKNKIDALTKRADRYDQAMDPAGYAKKQADITKSRVDVQHTMAETDKLLAETAALTGRANQNPQDLYDIIDSTIAKVPAARRGAFDASVEMTKGRIKQAFAGGDPKDAQAAVNDLVQELRSVNVALNTRAPQVTVTPQAQQDLDETAEQLFLGNVLPSTLSKRSATYNATLAKANRISLEETGKPINIVKMEADMRAANRFMSAANSEQRQRFNALGGTVVNTIDEVRSLADELKQGSIQLWNRAKRSTIQQVYGNTPQSELAARYIGAVNTLKEEFANLAQGGYAPTEAAWRLANEQINTDFGFKDMNASLYEVQRLLKYRLNAFGELRPTYLGGPTQLNLGQPPGGPPAGTPPQDSAAVPDLSGLPKGQLAVYDSGPFKGKWRKGADGKAVKVGEVK